MSATLLLDRTANDLCLDASRHIAVASTPYSTTQQVACACRMIEGDAWYDQARGIAYFATVLGQPGAPQIYKAALEAAAEGVDNVATATAVLVYGRNRIVTGQIQITDVGGTASVATT